MESIQFIQITPEQLQNSIIEGVKFHIEELKKEFQPKTPTEYLTRKETAGALKVDLSTIWRWTNEGILQSYGISNKVYYKRKEVEEALTLLKK